MMKQPTLGSAATDLAYSTALASVKELDALLAASQDDALLQRARLADADAFIRSLILSRRNRTAGSFVFGVAVGILIAIGTVLS